MCQSVYVCVRMCMRVRACLSACVWVSHSPCFCPVRHVVSHQALAATRTLRCQTTCARLTENLTANDHYSALRVGPCGVGDACTQYTVDVRSTTLNGRRTIHVIAAYLNVCMHVCMHVPQQHIVQLHYAKQHEPGPTSARYTTCLLPSDYVLCSHANCALRARSPLKPWCLPERDKQAPL